MADTVRERCMARLLENIQAVDGIKTATRDPRAGPVAGSHPYVAIYEIVETASDFGTAVPYSKQTKVLTVLCEVWVSGKTDGPRRLNNIVGDICDAIQADPRLDENALDVREGDKRMFVSDDQQFLGMEMDLSILFRHDREDARSI